MKYLKLFFSHYREILLVILFSLLFFVPRYVAHLHYDALEDEILAIWNNLMYSPTELLLVPDFTHPPLWYLLMDLPTKVIGAENGIFYYRLIQMIALYTALLLAIFYFIKNLGKNFIYLFFLLFLTNNYLIHVTSQHRMYAFVLGISILYSFAWLDVLRRKLLPSNWTTVGLGVLAAAGFLVNFSSVWAIGLWPLIYVIFGVGTVTNRLQKMSLFVLPFLMTTGWFYQIFWKNAQTSVEVNQWASQLTMNNVFQVVGSFFGLMPKLAELNTYNFLVPLVLFFILIVFIYELLKPRFQDKNLLVILFLTIIIFFGGYLLLVKLTGNSLLYIRPVVTLVVPIYVFITMLALNSRLGWVLFLFIVVVQIWQSVIYFSPTSPALANSGYDYYNYQINPIAHFNQFQFNSRDCLVPLPHWNYMAARFFLDKKIEVIDVWYHYSINTPSILENCNAIYVLEQFSVTNYDFQKLYRFLFEDKAMILLETYQNQNLYKVN